jgi:hypothetical protein
MGTVLVLLVFSLLLLLSEDAGRRPIPPASDRSLS